MNLNPEDVSGGYYFGIWTAQGIERYNGMTNYWNDIFSGLDATFGSVMNWKDAFNTNYGGDGGGSGGRTAQGKGAENGQGGAWNITNNWTDTDEDGLSYSEKYSDYYKKRAQEAVNNGEKYDCMDFQLRVLFEFAIENSLPLELESRTGKKISQKDFSNPEDFWGTLTSLSASDLILNTSAVPFTDKKAGDMRLLKQEATYHVVGYNGDSKMPLTYGNHTGGKPDRVKNSIDWTVTNHIERMKITFIIGFNKGEIFGTGYVLRWKYLNNRGK